MNATPFTILVIDDDPDDLEILCTAVETIGPPLVCKPYHKCKPALDLLFAKKIKPDLVFIDMHLDDMDGLDCLRLLKSNKELEAIPVAMITEVHNEKTCMEAMKTGALHYFKKPGHMADVVDLIRSTLPEDLQKSVK